MTRIVVVGDGPLCDAVVTAARDRGFATGHRDADVAILCRTALPPEYADVGHVVVASRVGTDVIDDRHHRHMLSIERSVTHRSHTLLRTTHVHQEMWTMLERWSRWPVMVVPNDTRFQPIDGETVAEILVTAAADRSPGRLEDLGGRYAYDAIDLAGSFLAKLGRRRPIIAVNRPGIAGAALRAGAATTPNRDTNGDTWNDFVERV